MEAAVLLLNFGEPENATPEEVVAYLERIFSTNAALEPGLSPDELRARHRQLAERRAPGLLEEYREIGGSPLGRQAEAQAEALEAELRRRGREVRCYVGMQFTEPTIAAAAERARADGAPRLVALPVYPLCGRSTTVAALEALAGALEAMGWKPETREIAGWHDRPDYVRLWVDAIRATAARGGADLADPDTRLVFSAHGTPVRYLTEGNRYDRYVEQNCAAIAAELGVADYVLGYQNHGNRPVEWTQPDIETALRGVRAKRVVVVPVSFLHEQSETLSELDIELREEAEELGLEFHRVPVPHDDPRLAVVLADLVEPLLTDGAGDLAPCHCRPTPGTVCTNG